MDSGQLLQHRTFFFFLIANYQVYDLANVLLNVLLKLQIVA